MSQEALERKANGNEGLQFINYYKNRLLLNVCTFQVELSLQWKNEQENEQRINVKMKETNADFTKNKKTQPNWKKLHKLSFLHSELYLDMKVGREELENCTQEKKDAADHSYHRTVEPFCTQFDLHVHLTQKLNLQCYFLQHSTYSRTKLM